MPKLICLLLTIQFITLLKGQDSTYKYEVTDLQRNYKISSSGFRDIYVDALKRKWFASLNAGVMLLDGRSVKRINSQQGVASNFIFRVNEDSKHNIWLATYNGVTCLYNNGSIKSFLKGSSEKNNFFTTVFESRQKKIYAMGFKGMYIQNFESWVKIDSSNRYLHAINGANDTSWFMNETGLFYTTEKIKLPLKYYETPTVRNYKLYIDGKKRLWVLALDGVGYIENGIYHKVSDQKGFLSIAEFDGNIFLGSNGAGLFLFDIDSNQLIHVNELKETSITGLASQSNGLLVAGIGLYFLERPLNQQLNDFPLVKNVSNVKYTSKTSYLYVTKDRKICYYRGKSNRVLLALSDNAVDNPISSYEDSNTAYFSTQEKLFKYTLRTDAVTEIKLPSKRATYEYLTFGDTVYVGRDDGFFKIVGDTVYRIQFPEKYKETPNVSALTKLDDRILVFKQGVGLFEYKQGEFKKIELPESILYHTVISMAIVKDSVFDRRFFVLLQSNGFDFCQIKNNGDMGMWRVLPKYFNGELGKHVGEFIPELNGYWYNGANQVFRFVSENLRYNNPFIIHKINPFSTTLQNWNDWTENVNIEISFKSNQRNIVFNWCMPENFESDNYQIKWEIKDSERAYSGLNTDGVINHSFSTGGHYKITYSLIDILNGNTVKQIVYNVNVPLFWYETIAFKVLIILIFSVLLVAITFFTLKKINLRRLEVLRRDIEFGELRSKALQNLIAPHLLFNLFNNIQTRIITNRKEDALKILSTLSDFIRKSLSFVKSDLVTLEDELEIVSQYVSLESSREVQNNLEFKIVNNAEIDLATIEFPSMVLQPLVENAIKYGSIGNKIYVEIFAEDNQLIVSVTNSISSAQKERIHSSGNGLKLIEDKLRLIHLKYGKEYMLTCGNKGEGFQATITKITAK